MKGGLNLNRIAIVPTGDEILAGTVLDTNSPAIMSIILKDYPAAEIKRYKPVIDKEIRLSESLDSILNLNYDLIILIGGSGGGHRYVPTLAKDFVSDTIINKCKNNSYIELYGSNGHLWSKLVVGQVNKTYVINVPGPHTEAISAVDAFIKCSKITDDINLINEKIALAVKNHYG